MATLNDIRPLIADLLDGLGMVAGSAILRQTAAEEAALPEDDLAELEYLRDVIERVCGALDAKGSATGKVSAIRALLT